jgi:glycerophosphoryl diester phosphodiesterase
VTVDWTPASGMLRVGGHRGAAAVAPENTMAGFELAAHARADYLELDIRLASDGMPVVFHDDELDRTTDGAGTVEALSFAQLRRLDAGSWWSPSFTAQRIPTLDEVLALVERHPHLGATIEAKGDATGAVIARALARSPARARMSICSFIPDELRVVAAADPALPRLLIVDRDRPNGDPIADARSARATGVNLPLEWLDPARVRDLHAAGLLVAGGTVDDEPGIARALELGVDAVDSNDPANAVRWRDALVTTP